MKTIDGKKIAGGIIEKLGKLPTPKKILAVFLIGEDESSLNFMKQKEGIAKKLGVDFRIYKFADSPEIDNDFLREEIGKTALKKNVGGVMVQLPLPERISTQYVLNAVPREKDIDVLGERALGAFYTERNPVLPPAVETTIETIFQTPPLFSIRTDRPPIPAIGGGLDSRPDGSAKGGDQAHRDSETFRKKTVAGFLSSKKVAVVGLGYLIGKPISLWLMRKAKDLYLLHKGSDFGILKQADIVISGVGSPGLIKPEMLKQGAGVIDFGYSSCESQICGDFDSRRFAISNLQLAFYTPTPGGTGPILVAKLFENFYKLNK